MIIKTRNIQLVEKISNELMIDRNSKNKRIINIKALDLQFTNRIWRICKKKQRKKIAKLHRNIWKYRENIKMV